MLMVLHTTKVLSSCLILIVEIETKTTRRG